MKASIELACRRSGTRRADILVNKLWAPMGETWRWTTTSVGIKMYGAEHCKSVERLIQRRCAEWALQRRAGCADTPKVRGERAPGVSWRLRGLAGLETDADAL